MEKAKISGRPHLPQRGSSLRITGGSSSSAGCHGVWKLADNGVDVIAVDVSGRSFANSRHSSKNSINGENLTDGTKSKMHSTTLEKSSSLRSATYTEFSGGTHGFAVRRQPSLRGKNPSHDRWTTKNEMRLDPYPILEDDSASSSSSAAVLSGKERAAKKSKPFFRDDKKKKKDDVKTCFSLHAGFSSSTSKSSSKSSSSSSPIMPAKRPDAGRSGTSEKPRPTVGVREKKTGKRGTSSSLNKKSADSPLWLSDVDVGVFPRDGAGALRVPSAASMAKSVSTETDISTATDDVVCGSKFFPVLLVSSSNGHRSVRSVATRPSGSGALAVAMPRLSDDAMNVAISTIAKRGKNSCGSPSQTTTVKNSQSTKRAAFSAEMTGAATTRTDDRCHGDRGHGCRREVPPVWVPRRIEEDPPEEEEEEEHGTRASFEVPRRTFFGHATPYQGLTGPAVVFRSAPRQKPAPPTRSVRAPSETKSVEEVPILPRRDDDFRNSLTSVVSVSDGRLRGRPTSPDRESVSTYASAAGDWSPVEKNLKAGGSGGGSGGGDGSSSRPASAYAAAAPDSGGSSVCLSSYGSDPAVSLDRGSSDKEHSNSPTFLSRVRSALAHSFDAVWTMLRPGAAGAVGGRRPSSRQRESDALSDGDSGCSVNTMTDTATGVVQLQGGSSTEELSELQKLAALANRIADEKRRSEEFTLRRHQNGCDVSVPGPAGAGVSNVRRSRSFQNGTSAIASSPVGAFASAYSSSSFGDGGAFRGERRYATTLRQRSSWSGADSVSNWPFVRAPRDRFMKPLREEDPEGQAKEREAADVVVRGGETKWQTIPRSSGARSKYFDDLETVDGGGAENVSTSSGGSRGCVRGVYGGHVYRQDDDSNPYLSLAAVQQSLMKPLRNEDAIEATTPGPVLTPSGDPDFSNSKGKVRATSTFAENEINDEISATDAIPERSSRCYAAPRRPSSQVLHHHNHHRQSPPSAYRFSVAPELDRVIEALTAASSSGSFVGGSDLIGRSRGAPSAYPSPFAPSSSSAPPIDRSGAVAVDERAKQLYRVDGQQTQRGDDVWLRKTAPPSGEYDGDGDGNEASRDARDASWRHRTSTPSSNSGSCSLQESRIRVVVDGNA